MAILYKIYPLWSTQQRFYQRQRVSGNGNFLSAYWWTNWAKIAMMVQDWTAFLLQKKCSTKVVNHISILMITIFICKEQRLPTSASLAHRNAIFLWDQQWSVRRSYAWSKALSSHHCKVLMPYLTGWQYLLGMAGQWCLSCIIHPPTWSMFSCPQFSSLPKTKTIK